MPRAYRPASSGVLLTGPVPRWSGSFAEGRYRPPGAELRASRCEQLPPKQRSSCGERPASKQRSGCGERPASKQRSSCGERPASKRRSSCGERPASKQRSGCGEQLPPKRRSSRRERPSSKLRASRGSSLRRTFVRLRAVAWRACSQDGAPPRSRSSAAISSQPFISAIARAVRPLS